LKLNGKYEEVCSCAFRAYNQALTDIKQKVEGL
jgi:hypothetical protein